MHILLDADLILYNGLHLEGKMATILQKMHRFTPTHAVSDALDEAALIASPECENMYDPHIWFDVALWKNVTHAITDKLCALTPEHSECYRRNHQRYLAELTELEQDIVQLIAQIPEEKRFLVTTHDAFSYFGRAYNVHVIGLQGINLDAEPCIKDMHALIDTICNANIPAIFVESSLPHRSIEAIALAVQARGHQVIIGDELYGDTIGTVENNTETYIKTILHNVRSLVKGLNPLYTVT
jgi:manganese/zinc/iron transport system substrate-binding protein